MQERLVRLFREHFGSPPSAILAMAGDGSTRRYRRFLGSGGSRAIGAVGPDHEENRAFLSFTRAFRSAGFPVPELYRVDEEAGVYLLEDLGDTTLFDEVEEARAPGGGFPAELLALYRKTLEWLPRFQVEGDSVVDYSVAYPRHAFDRQSILWDLNYFKYNFLKLAHVPFSEARLETDFEALVTFLLRADTSFFLYRDFQSRNVMLRDGEPWFIDYQGGRRGALQYDLASLLYDAKADIPEAVRRELMETYLSHLETLVAVDRAAYGEQYRGYVLVRIMQALGAYGYRGFFERKPHFLRSVPFAARTVGRLLDDGLPVDLPEIELVLGRIARQWSGYAEEPEAGGGLRVFLHSFSYRRGYPEDVSGHGGGFVFDCRALPNPGREERFANLTGRDAPVARFMQESATTDSFWERVRGLAEAQVADYLARGFSSLTIAFGCTGGQHRSVYLAERLARHLGEVFPEASIRLFHREEPYWPSPQADGSP